MTYPLDKQSSLYKAMYELACISIDIGNSWANTNRLITREYQKIPVDSIEYDLEIFNLAWDKMEYFEVYEWDSLEIGKVIEYISKKAEFCIATEEIAKEFNLENFLPHGLHPFIIHILKNSPNNIIDLSNIEIFIRKYINDVFNEVKQKETKWYIHVWLNNIFIESDEIILRSDTFLRRPTIEQLSIIEPKRYIEQDDKILSGKFLKWTAVLTLSMSINKAQTNSVYDNIQKEVDFWIALFQLYRPNSCSILFQSIVPDSIFEHQVSENIDVGQNSFSRKKVDFKDKSNFKIYIKKEEEVMLHTFIEKSAEELKKITYETYLAGSYIDLALHRYIDSLLKTEVNAYKILSAMTSLEALLSDGTNEILYKIKMRVAGLLRFFGYNTIVVLENIQKAYSLRSKLVHGANTKEFLEFARKNTYDIVNYNRICLLICLQLKNTKDKNSLIKLIDSSFINENSFDELKELLEKNVVILLK